MKSGLRAQILALLAVVAAVTFLPLGFATKNLVRAAVLAERGAPSGAGALGARGAQIVELVGLYGAIFAALSFVVLYGGLTVLVVRPIERLERAAERVARGARTFEAPARVPREVRRLGESLEAMTRALVDEEATLRAKLTELSRTTLRLAETSERLEDSARLASVGRLAAGVAHEIGNPLSAIMGMHDLVADGATSELERADFLARMRRETERIHVVIRDLLDYARPASFGEAGGADVHGADVAAAVDDVRALLAPQPSFRDVALDVDVPAGLVVGLASSRLVQVVMNLLLNAADALRGEGGGRAEGRSGRVRVTARREPASEGEARVVLVVEDDGPGVPEGLRARLFQPFTTTKDVGHGTGLGLAVCRGIVESAGGTIRLDETYDAGARFVVELPASGA